MTDECLLQGCVVVCSKGRKFVVIERKQLIQHGYETYYCGVGLDGLGLACSRQPKIISENLISYYKSLEEEKDEN